tara:strand:- start:1848 stop:2315 length:468 start_codon:yes stop_codon:yes gene_type:complete
MKVDNTKDYIKIIKYLNYQKINVNNELLQTIQEISKSLDLKSPNLLEYNITLHNYKYIKRLIELFIDIPILAKSEEYLYYIFIILNLPEFMIKNLNRYYYAALYRQHQIKPQTSYLEILQKKDKLNSLITNLEILKKNNNEFILLFIDTLNVFFT